MLIDLPLPPSELHSHNKGHWTRRVKKVKEYRDLANLVAKQAMIREGVNKGDWTKGAVVYSFFVRDNRRRDSANLMQSCKPAIDGVIDAGLLPDDSWQFLGIAGVSVAIDKERPRVELHFLHRES